MKFSQDQFSNEQRQLLKELLIVEYEYFYHFTDSDNYSAIKEQGLDPNKDDSFIADHANRPDCTFFYIDSAHKGLVENARQSLALDNKKLIIFRIKAIKLLEKSYGLDWTTSQTMGLAMELYKKDDEISLLPEEAKHLIKRVGFLVCYDHISTAEIEVSYDHGQNFERI